MARILEAAFAEEPFVHSSPFHYLAAEPLAEAATSLLKDKAIRSLDLHQRSETALIETLFVNFELETLYLDLRNAPNHPLLLHTKIKKQTHIPR